MLVLDSGGVSALGGRSSRARIMLRWLTEFGGTVVVPAVVLAECLTGNSGLDAEVNRVLRLVLGGREPSIVNEPLARLAARLRYDAQGDDPVDALVAAEAIRQSAATVVLTSDPSDLSRLLANAPLVYVRAV